MADGVHKKVTYQYNLYQEFRGQLEQEKVKGKTTLHNIQKKHGGRTL